ncbi:flagellar basal body rod protein FlgB [Sphingomonas sp. KRR8]|uniref:flagellar basal body rod protein FlgB n=1 Tax=Sphingomonas sp. KRR8 TaxID=2942996 RepID=UPI0020217374|nr:flagellar basal body rod protein FlgB [Sphingomonas sp. KRR8]URD61904.1 flagellar basal body rod protein FlgB [Sphingomonas sp. KRR8]
MPNLPPLFGGLVSAMRHLGDRQKVIAENVANADTPGYKTKTLEEPDFRNLLSDGSVSGVSRPSVSLTSGMAALGAHFRSGSHVIDDRHVSETKPDGNNVTLEDQLLQLGQIQADYSTLTNLYAKQMKLMKIALGRGGQ